MFEVMGGDAGVFKMMAGGEGVGASAMFKPIRGVSAMFKVMAGGEGRQPCSRWCEGVRDVSHVQGVGRG